MVGIGFTEMIIIAGIALVVLGPEKFPEFAKIAIRAIRDIRGYFDEVKTEIAKEVKPLEKELNELTKKSNELYREILTETDPSYTSKGYTPSTNYVEHSYQTDTDIAKQEERQDRITSEGVSEDTSGVEITSNDVQETTEPYDPDIPQADLQKMTQATPHNDEEFRDANEETDIDNQNNIQLPERLDG